MDTTLEMIDRMVKVDLGGFKPDFLANLVGSALEVLGNKIEDPQMKELLNHAEWIYQLLYWQAAGIEVPEIMVLDIPGSVATLSELIFDLNTDRMGCPVMPLIDSWRDSNPIKIQTS